MHIKNEKSELEYVRIIENFELKKYNRIDKHGRIEMKTHNL